MKRSPLKKKTPLRRGPGFAKTPRKGLRQVSARRRRELKEYSERRASFLSMPENQWCPVAAAGLVLSFAAPIDEDETAMECLEKSKRLRTCDVHHKKGRSGKLLNDERFFLAVSREGHTWIHAHPNEARAHGWLI